MGAPDGTNRADSELASGTASPRSSFDRALSDLTDDARRTAARSARVERHDREVAAGLSATFLGTLVELSESGNPVLLVTVGGHHHRGVVTSVGTDVVLLTTGTDRQRTLLAPFAIEAIRETAPAHSRTLHEAPGPTMGELLDQHGVDHRVTVQTVGGNRFMGRLLRVGVDQLALQLDGERDSLTIPLRAIAEAVIER